MSRAFTALQRPEKFSSCPAELMNAGIERRTTTTAKLVIVFFHRLILY
jgi:hypothetical protein